MTHAERCQAESTRDVAFVIRAAVSQPVRAPDGRFWEIDSIWLDRAEAEAFRASHAYRWAHSDVYGMPTYGQLSELLRRDPTLPCDCGARLGMHDFRFCPYCGGPIAIKEASP